MNEKGKNKENLKITLQDHYNNLLKVNFDWNKDSHCRPTAQLVEGLYPNVQWRR